MYIKDYKYLTPTIACGDHNEVEGINREGYTTRQYLDKIKAPVLTKRTAVLYAGGFNIHQSESRDVSTVNTRHVGSVPFQKTSMVIKEATAYSLHQWIGAMEHNELVVYANINGNTCASSMHSLYEAERILKDGIADEVIVIAEERTSFNTLRIFNEHRVPLVCGDGFAMLVLTNDKTVNEIVDTKWFYSYDRNPFQTTGRAYLQVDTTKAIDNIKPHGTRTPSNNKAEEDLVKDRNAIYYKDITGHTQGVSAILEICMLIDDNEVAGSTLCVASGLGGFYGSCILHKE